MSIGVGAVVASAMVEWFGTQAALIAIGLLCPVLAVLCWRRLRGLDGRSTCSTPMSGCSGRCRCSAHSRCPPSSNSLVVSKPRPCPRAQAVFRQGDIGDRYFVIQSGEADVVGDGRVVASLGAGEGFGEIALLGDPAARRR